MELNSHDAVLAVVRYGLGVSILPMLHGAEHDADPDLKIVPIPGFQRSVSLVEQQAHPRSHLTAKLLETIAEAAPAQSRR